MSPRHILPRFSFAFYCPGPLHFPASFPLEFPTFSSPVSSDNMFREISTLRRAAHHDTDTLPSLLTSFHLNLSNRFERLTSLQVCPDIYAYISDDG
jgi:hypothetical protein